MSSCAIARCPRPAQVRGRCPRHHLTTTARGYGAAHQRERAAGESGARCVACGCMCNLQRDHIIPLSAGGTEHPINKRWLCRCSEHRCHDRFGARRDRPGKGGQNSGGFAFPLTVQRLCLSHCPSSKLTTSILCAGWPWCPTRSHSRHVLGPARASVPHQQGRRASPEAEQ